MSQEMLKILARGPSSTKALAALTGMSRQTVNRKLRALEDSVVRLDTVRPPLYYSVEDAFGAGDRIPVAAIDSHGNVDRWGDLRPLASGGYFLQTTPAAPRILKGDNGDGLYEDVPFFLEDLRPQGFIGRQIGRELHGQSNLFPPDPRDWNQEHIGRYLVANGDDLPGNLQIGVLALDRLKRPPQRTRRDDYLELADRVVRGKVHGSSAGGEQPKFAIFSKERNGHVIVKFSPEGGQESAGRWRDVLVTECIASEVLQYYDFPAAELKVFDTKERLFVEALRFDRSGEYGRFPCISMRAVDNEFSGVGSGWVHVAKRLEQRNLISWQHLVAIAVYWGFGRLINNTDMHLGNMSFSIDDAGLRPAPMYDMCSMGFAPKNTGETPPLAFTPPSIEEPLAFAGKTIGMVKDMAKMFWSKLGDDKRISDELRYFLQHDNPGDTIN